MLTRQTRIVLLILLTILPACVRHIPRQTRVVHEDTATSAALSARLREHVEVLSEDIGPRSYRHPEQLDAAGEYVLGAMRNAVGEERATDSVLALPSLVSHRAYTQMRWRNLHRCVADTRATRAARRARSFRQMAQQPYWNLELTLPGSDRPHEIIIIGAHYDSDVCESGGANPGADDNASGVAALLELAALFADRPQPRTLRFVAFTNEEEPFFQTDAMGSVQYLRVAKQRGDDIKAMLSLETLGYYDDAPGSQEAPEPFKTLLGISDRGDFLTFVSSWRSRELTRKAVASFHAVSGLPCEGFVAAPWLVEEVHWSDNWAFDQEGVPALMVTDTAPARNRCYHQACDTADRLDYQRLARAVAGLAHVIENVARDH